jgi:2,4-dienoyl-CoA reductase-like NADH-dependent reductase (Old Yellow Enzyme family)
LGYPLEVRRNRKEGKEIMLFEPFEFSGMKLKNRIVSVPVVSNLATEDGYVTDDLIERYRRIAEGGTAWTIIEDVVVLSRKSPFNLRIWDDKFIPGPGRQDRSSVGSFFKDFHEGISTNS